MISKHGTLISDKLKVLGEEINQVTLVWPRLTLPTEQTVLLLERTADYTGKGK